MLIKLIMLVLILGPAIWSLMYSIKEEASPFWAICSAVCCGLVGLFCYGLIGWMAIISVQTDETVAVFEPGTYRLNANNNLITTPDGKSIKAVFEDSNTPLTESDLEILESGINGGAVRVRLTVRKANECHWLPDLFLDETDRFLYAEYAYED